MAATPYLLPRETRESAIGAGNGTVGPYGPSLYKIFDTADVKVFAKALGETKFTDVTAGCTITKTGALAYDTFSVTFGSAVPATTAWYHQARRVAERSIAVTKGGTLDSNQLEKELSKQASVVSEVRRDLDRAYSSQHGSTPGLVIPGAAGELLEFDAAGNIIGSGENVTSIAGSTAAAAASAAAAATQAGIATTQAGNASASAASALASYNAVVAAIAALGNPLVFKGVWDASAGTFPGGGAAKAGWQYIVSVPGTVGGVLFELNDMIIATVNNASTTVYAANWFKIETDLVQSVAGLSGVISAVSLRDALDTSPYVATRTALKALDTTKDTVAILTEAGREGTFLWRAGNFSSLITADATEGLYVKANAVASTAGAWVRQRRDLDVQLDWFGTITGANAGANAATNDAAFASAKGLSSVLTVLYGAGIYEHAATLTLDRSGLSLGGYSCFPVFGTGGGTNGTIIKWTGASGGVIAQMNEASGNDTSNNHIEGIEFDGNALAGLGIDVRNTQFPSVENCAIRNLRITSVPIGLRCLPLAVAGTGLNCIYRGRFKNLSIQIAGAGVGVYCSGVTGVGNTTFCNFEEIHVTHENEGAFYIIGADDNTFLNCGASRVALGNGAGIVFDGTGATWVVGNTFYNFHAGVTDTTNGPALIKSTGAKARQNKIYGLSGVDFVPTITVTGGGRLFYDYLGSSYTSADASELAFEQMAAFKLANYTHPTDAAIMSWFDAGTFTPTISFGGAAVGVTYGRQIGRWRRINNKIQFEIDLVLTSKGSSVGAITIGGLPVVAIAGQDFVVAGRATAITSGIVLQHVLVAAGAQAVRPYKFATGAETQMTDADVTNTTKFTFSGEYAV